MIKKKNYKDLPPAANITVNVLLVLYSLLCIFPLLVVLIISFTDESAIATNGYQLIPAKTSMVAFEYLSGNLHQILRGYGVTLFSTAVGTLLSILITAAFAFPISRQSFKYRNRFAFYVYFTMLFNGGTVPYYIIYTQVIPLKNTIWSLIIPNMVGGFNILLMRTYFKQNIPDEIVEAAQIDGAGDIRVFSTIVMPLAKPVLATIGLLSAIGYWNDYFRNMLFIFDDSIMNLQYLLYRIQVQLNVINTNPEIAMRLGGAIPQETVRMAMVLVTIGPIIFLYPFLQKYFVKGLTIGAVKG